MRSFESVDVERYMRSEAERLLARDPSEFVSGLREAVDRIFLGSENKNPSMCGILELEEHTTVEFVNINGLRCEWVYHKGADSDRRLLYLHGGGMVAGSAKTHRALASRISKRTGAVILVPDYRLAPEHLFPSALEDCVNSLNWLWDHAPNSSEPAKHVFIAGDSAGGGLMLSLLANYRDQLTKVPTAAATFSALTDFTASGDSGERNRETDALLSPEAIQGLGTLYSGSSSLTSPDLSPLFGSIGGLPPLHMQVSDSEVLLDDTLRFFEKHKACDGDGELHVYPGMVHVWQAFAPYLPEAEQSLDQLSVFFGKFD